MPGLSAALALIPGWREGRGLSWLTRSALPPPGHPSRLPSCRGGRARYGRRCGGLLSVHAFRTESLSWAARGPCAEGAGLACQAGPPAALSSSDPALGSLRWCGPALVVTGPFGLFSGFLRTEGCTGGIEEAVITCPSCSLVRRFQNKQASGRWQFLFHGVGLPPSSCQTAG